MFLSSDKKMKFLGQKLCDKDFISNHCNLKSAHRALFRSSIKALVKAGGSRALFCRSKDQNTFSKLLEKLDEDFDVIDFKIVKKDATLNADRADGLLKVLLTRKEFDI